MGYAAAKKRKRQQEMDDAKKAAEEAAATAAMVKTEMASNNTTPDYAAGLSSNLNPPAVAQPPAYAPAPPTATVPVATPVAALPGGPGVNIPLPPQPLPQNPVTRLVQLPTHPLPQARMPMGGLGQPRPNLPPANVLGGLGGLQASVLQQRVQPGQVRQTYVQAPGQQQVIRQSAVQTIAAPVTATPGQRRNLSLTMIVETHFQMNYNTGEWKRIKKYRRLEDVQG